MTLALFAKLKSESVFVALLGFLICFFAETGKYLLLLLLLLLLFLLLLLLLFLNTLIQCLGVVFLSRNCF